MFTDNLSLLRRVLTANLRFLATLGMDSLCETLFRRSIELPRIDYNAILPRAQDAHRHDVVQPVVIWCTSLENYPEMGDIPWLAGTGRLEEDVGTIVGDQIVSRIRCEDVACCVEGSPVRT